MSYEKVIRDRLLATAAVNDVVGARISTQRKHEGRAFPNIVMQTIGEVPTLTMGQAIKEVQARVQVDCFSKEYAEAANLADAVRNALHMYESGAVTAIIYLTRRTIDDKETDVFMVSQDFTVTYNAN